MAQTLDYISVVKGTETEYVYPDEYYTVKNPTNEQVYYRYDNTSDVYHNLNQFDVLSTLNQTVYFSVNPMCGRDVKLEVTKGVSELVAIANLNSGLGADSAIRLSVWGLQKFSEDFRIWRDTFCLGISKKVWNIAEVGGSTYPKQGSGVFDSGNTIGNSVVAYSREHSRYQPNSGILLSTAGSIPNAAQVGGIRRFGIATIEDGYYFEIDELAKVYTVVRQSDFQNYTATANQTTFSYDYDILATSAVYVRVKYAGDVKWQDITQDIASIDSLADTVTTTTPLALGDEICIVSVNNIRDDITQFLIDANIDLTQQTLFDIQAQWRGAGNVFFTVRSESAANISQGYQRVFRNIGKTDRCNISNPALSAYVECINVSQNGINFDLKLGCMNIAAEGGQDDVAEKVSLVSPKTPAVTIGDTGDNEVFLMIAHVPEYYKGRWNTRDCEVFSTKAWSDQKSHMTTYTAKDPLFLSGGILLKEKDEDNAILFDNNLNLANTSARNDTMDLASLTEDDGGRVQIDNTQEIAKVSKSLETVITNGEYFIVTGNRELTAGSANMGASITLGERT